MERKRTFCRICHNACALVVDIEGGRAVSVLGDSSDPLSRGYTCVKGRSQPAYLNHPDRLLSSMKRGADGAFAPIRSAQAVREIAERLGEIRDRHGPRAIAFYRGSASYCAAFVAMAFFDGLLRAMGTPMNFNTNTIDKGGKDTALSLHGRWMAPSQGFDDPEAILLIGINPVQTYTGFPTGSPRWFADGRRHAVKSIVIDPRRTDAARLAWLHLQPRPGFDVEIMAAFLRVILDEGLCDRAFVGENVRGLEGLRHAVEPFRPEIVARRADVPAEDLVRAARAYAGARRGYVMAGTGPSMSGPTTLFEYLVLCLETLCGRWLRAGEHAKGVGSLIPPPDYRAQAAPPRENWAWGEKIRVRNLSGTDAGMPTAALVDEILTPGEGKVRALLSFGGNPAAVFPDQLKTLRAMNDLDLLVQVDPWMSETARYAHYVIAPPMPLETPASTIMNDVISNMGKTGYGGGSAYARYTPALLARPKGSDLIEEWRFFHEVKCAMGYDPELAHPYAAGAGPVVPTTQTTTDELLEWLSRGSRIPFGEVKSAGEGACYPDPPAVVLEKEPGWTGRLDVANPLMMRDLAPYADRLAGSTAVLGLRLLCRREGYRFNSSFNAPESAHVLPYNPAFMHPDDLVERGLSAGDRVEVVSGYGVIPAIAGADPNLRRGLVSMTFGYGGSPDRDGEIATLGVNPNRLIPNDRVFDRFTGQPQMSNLPVEVRAAPDPHPSA